MTTPEDILDYLHDEISGPVRGQSYHAVIQVILDEEGPEALIQAILDAAQDTP